MLCNVQIADRKSLVFMRYFAVSHMLMLTISRYARKIPLCKSSDNTIAARISSALRGPGYRLQCCPSRDFYLPPRVPGTAVPGFHMSPLRRLKIGRPLADLNYNALSHN